MGLHVEDSNLGLGRNRKPVVAQFQESISFEQLGPLQEFAPLGRGKASNLSNRLEIVAMKKERGSRKSISRADRNRDKLSRDRPLPELRPE